MELYYLTIIDGNIMDLYTFYRSSKTNTQAYQQFLEQHRIISKADDVETPISSSPLATLMSNKTDIDKKVDLNVSLNDSVSSQVVQHIKTGERFF